FMATNSNQHINNMVSFVAMASYSMEELTAHVSLQLVAEAQDIQDREILKEIVRLPAPAVPPLAEFAEKEQAWAGQATAPGQPGPEQAVLRAVAAPSQDYAAI
ncbi:MAG: hypothetical protein ACKPKO_09115, partial [Candidatus Fonsibacter sp.]